MARGQDHKMQLSSPCSFYARKGTTDNSYFLVLTLSQEESTGYTPSDETPSIQYLLVLQKQLLALPIHSYINISAENYTPVMLHVRLTEELLVLMNFILFPATTQIIGHYTKPVRESLPPPSSPCGCCWQWMQIRC